MQQRQRGQTAASAQPKLTACNYRAVSLHIVSTQSICASAFQAQQMRMCLGLFGNRTPVFEHTGQGTPNHFALNGISAFAVGNV